MFERTYHTLRSLPIQAATAGPGASGPCRVQSACCVEVCRDLPLAGTWIILFKSRSFFESADAGKGGRPVACPANRSIHTHGRQQRRQQGASSFQDSRRTCLSVKQYSFDRTTRAEFPIEEMSQRSASGLAFRYIKATVYQDNCAHAQVIGLSGGDT